jgi:hypothetical protein
MSLDGAEPVAALLETYAAVRSPALWERIPVPIGSRACSLKAWTALA